MIFNTINIAQPEITEIISKGPLTLAIHTHRLGRREPLKTITIKRRISRQDGTRRYTDHIREKDLQSMVILLKKAQELLVVEEDEPCFWC